ncbi:MAG: DUF1552 domain-containing protein [Verrucomicrobiales bacterium]|nr:DUF1552 domain-containing protein [Verrucomicrobiales bacterium]
MNPKLSTNRRLFLKGLGVTLALPSLESFSAAEKARRMVAINIPLGFLPEKFFPKSSGESYESSDYLKLADHLRQDFTVISGTSHPGVDGGHSAEKSFLTAAPHPASRGFKNSISLDQVVAKRIGENTRYSSLTVGQQSLSWTANGVSIPRIESPAKVFETLFLSGSDSDRQNRKQQLSDGHSILDAVMEETQDMQRHISHLDKEKLDQFFTAVRETERRLTKADRWLDTPKPVVDAKQPNEVGSGDIVTWMRSHFEVIRLALITDSTRVVALGGASHSLVPPLPGVSMGYHGLSHHGKNPDMLRQLEIIDRGVIQTWVDFLDSLKETPDGEGNLLDSTQVLLGSNLGNASGHITTNLPIVLAGGGYRHGQHLAFDGKKNYPLPNLFVSMMQQMGLEIDTFSSSKSTMTGLL